MPKAMAFNLKIFISTTAIILVAGIAPGTAQPYAGWSHSAIISINTTTAGAGLAAGAVVNNFPMLVKLGSGYFNFSQCKPAGADIRFSNAAGTPLSFEIEQWDAGNGNAVIWVLVNQINGNATQNITLHWGNAAAQSESNGAAVFSPINQFLAVWHLDEDGSDAAAGYKDATGNSHHGTGVSMNAISDVPGPAGRGQAFDGKEDFITIAPMGVKPMAVTISHWSNVTSLFENGLEGVFMSDRLTGSSGAPLPAVLPPR